MSLPPFPAEYRASGLLLRHVAALAVWDRRRGPGGRGVGRPAARGGTTLVAGAALGPHWLWRLTVSIPVVVRRQRAPDQPRLADRGRTGASSRLRRWLVFAHDRRLRRRQALQVRAARGGMEELRCRRAIGPALRLRTLRPRPCPLAGRLCVVPSAEGEIRRRRLSRVAGRPRPPPAFRARKGARRSWRAR